MFTDRSLALVKELENTERTNAERFGMTYNSKHEGIAVLKEEVDEASDELNAIISYLDPIWESIKKNDGNSELIQKLILIALGSEYLALESAQIHAVAEKFIETLRKETEENDRS